LYIGEWLQGHTVKSLRKTLKQVIEFLAKIAPRTRKGRNSMMAPNVNGIAHGNLS